MKILCRKFASILFIPLILSAAESWAGDLEVGSSVSDTSIVSSTDDNSDVNVAGDTASPAGADQWREVRADIENQVAKDGSKKARCSTSDFCESCIGAGELLGGSALIWYGIAYPENQALACSIGALADTIGVVTLIRLCRKYCR